MEIYSRYSERGMCDLEAITLKANLYIFFINIIILLHLKLLLSAKSCLRLLFPNLQRSSLDLTLASRSNYVASHSKYKHVFVGRYANVYRASFNWDVCSKIDCASMMLSTWKCRPINAANNASSSEGNAEIFLTLLDKLHWTEFSNHLHVLQSE